LLILTLFLALHALYNWATPLGEGPDEPGHLAYTLFLATAQRLPAQGAEGDVPGEGHQPPLAYALAVPAVAWLPVEERLIVLTANPRFVWAGGDEPAAFMRGSRELWPWRGLTLAWHMVRAVSGLWGAVAVLCTYLAARRLRPEDPWFAWLATVLVALNPQLLFTTALASNDALLAALGAATLWWCVRPEPSPARWAAVAGVLFGLALLTKQSALLLGPLLLWGGWRVANGELRRWGTVTLGWGLTTTLVAGWWFWRNLALYGDLFGLGAFKAEFATQPFVWGDPAAWAGALAQLFGSFWARFGWMSVGPPGWTLWAYGIVCALAALGWALQSTKRRSAKRKALTPIQVARSRQGSSQAASNAVRGTGGRAASPDTLVASAWVGPLIAVAMTGAWTLAFAGVAGLVAWQGRMLFPAIGAIGVLLAAGLRALPLPAPIAAGVALTALAVWMPAGVIRPAYSWAALAPAIAQEGLGNRAYARFAASWERGVALRGWRLDGPARPDTALPVALTWHSLEPVPRRWTVFVHLVAADETIVAESNTQPRGGTLPFPLWTPGDWMADTHTLPLPAGLAPGIYRLRVGLYRPDKDGQRQDVWAEDGALIGSYAELGEVRVEP
jgi:Dolichyl-phosphate-mannose-protein mannosyltransferase